MTTDSPSETFRQSEEVFLPVFFIPSKRPILAKRKPQNAVVDRLAKHIQLSTALVEIVATPPSKKLIEVTINSARKKMPPDDPMIWPISKEAIHRCRPSTLLSAERPKGLREGISLPVSSVSMDRLNPCVNRLESLLVHHQ